MANIHLESKKSPLVWAVPLVLAGLGLATWALWPAEHASTPSAALNPEATASAAMNGVVTAKGEGVAQATTPGAAPGMPTDVPADRSLGTLFDLDSTGKLSISGRTKDALDTILAAYPKGPNSKDWNTIEDKLAKELPKPALQEAMQLLHSSHQLSMGMEQLKNANPNAEAEGRSVEVYAQIKALRRQNFDSRTADLLFGDEETWGSVLLGIQAIEANTKLSPEAKKQQTQELINTLPADLRAKASQLLTPQ
jgi:lipase chaperone LimK